MHGSEYMGLLFCLSVCMFDSFVRSITPDSNQTKEKRKINDGKVANYLQNGKIECPANLSKIIHLVNIESSDCDNQNILSKNISKLFFIESSGRKYLTPRYACAIESAVKNTELSGHIIVVMTSPFLDVSFNNATCHLYTKHGGKNIFFRYANLDTIFEGTPIHPIHMNGHLKHHEEILTAVQYR